MAAMGAYSLTKRCCSGHTASTNASRQLASVTARRCILCMVETLVCFEKAIDGRFRDARSDDRDGDTTDAKQPPGYDARRDCQSPRKDRARLRRMGRTDPRAGHRGPEDEQERRDRQLAQTRVWPWAQHGVYPGGGGAQARRLRRADRRAADRRAIRGREGDAT